MNPRKSVSLYHLPATAGQKQPYPASPDVTVSGIFLPLDRYAHALEGGDLVAPYELYLPAAADVRVGDKAVIGGVTYFIKKVFTADFGGLPHRRCSLSTQA